MSKLKFLCIIILFYQNAIIHAQYLLQFVNTARNSQYGRARGVAESSDGTHFLARCTDDLLAFSSNGDSLVNTGHINDGGHAYDIALGPDGTVYLASGIYYYKLRIGNKFCETKKMVLLR